MSLLRRIEKGGGDGGQGGNRGGSSGGQGVPPGSPAGPAGGDESKLDMMRRRQAVAGAPQRSDNSYMDLKSRVQNRLLSELDQSMDLTRKAEVRTHIEELFNAILSEESMVLSRAERQRLFEAIIAEIL